MIIIDLINESRAGGAAELRSGAAAKRIKPPKRGKQRGEWEREDFASLRAKELSGRKYPVGSRCVSEDVRYKDDILARLGRYVALMPEGPRQIRRWLNQYSITANRLSWTRTRVRRRNRRLPTDIACVAPWGTWLNATCGSPLFLGKFTPTRTGTR